MGLIEPHPRKWTYEDYLQIPEDGLRHEIVDGEHIVSPSPGWNHQSAVGWLHVELVARIARTQRGWVVVAPLDVVLAATDVVQPDVLAIARGHEGRIRATHVEGAPDLVVEVLSASTTSRDRGTKLSAYDRGGVQEVWIVDHVARHVEQYGRSEGPLKKLEDCREVIRSTAFSGVSLDLRELWAELRG